MFFVISRDLNLKFNLRTFFHGCLFDAHSIDRENYLQLWKTIPEGLLLHLKNVKIYGFQRARLEVELLQFLLKKAKVLENMTYLRRRKHNRRRGEKMRSVSWMSLT